MGTQTTTQTIVECQTADVRHLMLSTTTEFTVFARHYKDLFVYDVDEIVTDFSVLVINGVSIGLKLQFVKDGVLIREHVYRLVDGALPTAGLPADRPPLGSVPPGCRLHIVSITNPNQQRSYTDAWYARLGWTTGSRPVSEGDMEEEEYGVFGGSSLSLTRTLRTNRSYGDFGPTSTGINARKEL